jgi:hypothetical protein
MYTRNEGRRVFNYLRDLRLAGLDALGEFLQLGAYLAEGDSGLQLSVAPLQLVQLRGQVHAHHAHLPLQAGQQNNTHRHILNEDPDRCVDSHRRRTLSQPRQNRVDSPSLELFYQRPIILLRGLLYDIDFMIASV